MLCTCFPCFTVAVAVAVNAAVTCSSFAVTFAVAVAVNAKYAELLMLLSPFLLCVTSDVCK